MTNLKNILLGTAFALATAGCGDKVEGPKKGDPVEVEGRVVRLNSWERGEMPSLSGYPATTKDLIIVGPAGKFYHVSTTSQNKWKDISLGDSVYLEGKYAGLDSWTAYKNIPVANVEYAKLETRETKK